MESQEQKIKRLLLELVALNENMAVDSLQSLQDDLLKHIPGEYANDIKVLIKRSIEQRELLSDAIAKKEKEVKAAVIDHGESVTIPAVSALLVSGRTSWNGNGLSGYAVAHPEILTFQSKGAPYVTLRFK